MSDGMMNEEFEDGAQRQAVCEANWREMHEGAAPLLHLSADLHYRHVLAAVQGAVWSILPERLAVIADLLAFRAAGGRLRAEEIRLRIGAARQQPRQPQHQEDAIAVLPIWGTIIPRGNLLMESSGATSVERLTANFRQLMAEPSVSAVVLDLDSPGGMVNGVDELSAEIHAARGTKPVWAMASPMAASAAYWLASAAEQLSVMPSGEVGSIGVMAMHENLGQALEKAGVSMTLITAGRYKAEGHPYGPLGEEAKAAIQERVDDYYDAFVRAVARNRNTSLKAVREGFGEGRVVGARKALGEGMVDHVETMDDLMTRLRQRLGSRPRAVALAPSVEMAADVPASDEQAAARARAELELRRRRLRLHTS